jgi:hypothetical protein
MSPDMGRKRMTAWALALKQASRRRGSLALSLLAISIRLSTRSSTLNLAYPQTVPSYFDPPTLVLTNRALI